MEFFNMIGSMFQLPAILTENMSAITAEETVSVTGEKPVAEYFSAAETTAGRPSGAKINKTDIGSPRNFIHVAHIGWHSQFGNDPAVNSNQRAVNKAGIQEEHLKDQTRLIEKRGGKESIRQEALSTDLPAGSSSSDPALGTLSTSNTNSSRPRMAPTLLQPPPNSYCSIVYVNPPAPLPPSFSNSAPVNSVPIPPPLPPFLNNCTSIVSVPPLAPPLPPSLHHDGSVDSVPMPPPLPPFFNNASSAPYPPPLLPSFNVCAPVDSHNVPPPPPPLPPSFIISTSMGCGLPLPPPPPPQFSLDDSVSCSPLPPPPSPCNDFPSGDNMPPPLPPSPLGSQQIQPQQSGKGTKLSEKGSQKKLPKLDQNNLLNQIKKGILLRSVKKERNARSLIASENEGMVSALMDVIQKRHRATHSSCEDNQTEDEWDD